MMFQNIPDRRRRHCRIIAVSGPVLLLMCRIAGPAVAENYGYRILAPAERHDPLPAAVGDLAVSLEQMTGRPFAVLDAATEPLQAEEAAIVVALAEHESVPADFRRRLDGADRETYLIYSTGSDRLWIVANHARGLSHGIYDYLERLGCRWYFPNPNWERIPEREDVTLRLDERIAPAFIARGFFGTGGFGPRNPVDPELEMRDRWTDWMRRNRFGEQLSGYGHVGHGFSIRQAEALRANPEYRAMVGGERVEYRPAIKFCVSNPEIMERFVDDRLREMRERVARDPDSLSSHFVGADPSDSGGFCECPDCRQIGNGSVSDQVFHTANVVARAIADEFPGRGVSMYAYGFYANLPSIDLEPNLHITVIPYAFQRTGMTGDDLLRAWGERIARDGLDQIAPPALYDYWSITDWGRNVPDFDFRRRPPERIRFWHEQGVGAIRFESTYSAGAIALGLNLACRLMWDPGIDSDAWLAEFYDDAFGPAAPPMRRMLERWAAGFLLTRQELALSFRDLQAAEALADSAAIRARLDDYAQYLQYLRCWHTFSNVPADETEKREAEAHNLARLLWRLYPSAMVHTYRLWQLLGYRQVPAIKAYFNPAQPEAPEWDTVAPPDGAEQSQWIADGVADYPPLGFETRQFEGDLVPLDDTLRATGEFGPVYSSIHSTTFHFLLQPDAKTLPLKFSVRNWIEGQEVRLRVYDPNDQPVFERTFPAPSRDAPQEWHTLEIPVNAAGRYRVEVFDQSNGFSLRVPEGVPMALTPLLPHGWVRVYFYVPEGLKKLALINPRRNVPASLYDPDGTEIVLEQHDSLVVINVPEGFDGRVWSLRRPGSSQRVRLLNAPEVFALTPETLMIPADAR